MFFSIALVHCSAGVVPLLTEVARDVIADVELIHMVDEGMQLMIEEAGAVTEPVTRRVCSYAMNAREAGAEAVVLTSPVLGSTIDAVQASVNIPVMRIDEAMAETAVQLGTNVGVLGADEITLDTTVSFLRERADARGKEITLEVWRCEDALLALKNGDLEAYDYIVANAVDRLADNDMIVLADVMMQRVVRAAGERVGVPVLASPRHGFEELAKKLNYFRR
ncbi:MAG: aspartate/glutamate racemase family protein [Planctomycetota bacterium]